MNLKKKEVYKPLVSIVIPAYNASNYLAEAINSALGQTYDNIEIIVVNDGSRDDGETERIALSYGNKIRYFYKENGGSSSALNLGIKEMRGEWFSWLSHDDLYYPEKIDRQITYLNELMNSEMNTVITNNVLFAGAEFIDANARLLKRPSNAKLQNISNRLKSISGNEYLISEPTRNTFHGCSCLVHKSVFENIGIFNENLRLINDADMWYRIYSSGYSVHYVPEILVTGRIHRKQVSVQAGYSHHHAEQDLFWERSLMWLISNHPKNDTLFFKFGRNAYLKTRFIEGEKAFDHLKKVNPRIGVKLDILCVFYKFRSNIQTFAKKLYLRMKT